MKINSTSKLNKKSADKIFLPLTFTKTIKKEINGEEKNVFYFTASSESIDRSGEKIMLAGWDFSKYMNHPIVLFQHDSWSDELENIIGTTLEINVDETSKSWSFGFFLSKANPKSAMLEAMMLEGISVAVSVGFLPRNRQVDADGVMTITEAELIEISVVKIPCNQDATRLKAMAKSFGVDLKEIVDGEIPEDEDASKENETTEDEKKEDEVKVDVEGEDVEVEGDETEEGKSLEDVSKKAEGEEDENVEDEAPEVENMDDVENEDKPIKPITLDEIDALDDDEEITIEVEDEEEETLEIEVDGEKVEVEGDEVSSQSTTESEEDASQDGKSVLQSEQKAGARLSKETLQQIAEVETLVKDMMSAGKSLLATLTSLVDGGTGGKGFEGEYITFKKSELIALRNKIRNSDKIQDEILSDIKGKLER